MIIWLVEEDGRQLAFRLPDRANWVCPWGGSFSKFEQEQMTRFASGEHYEIVLNRGTSWERWLRRSDLFITIEGLK
jgi:hypothetical protein